MITANQFITQARNGGYIGIPYSKLDCQAFVERVLKDAGESGHNWRGSNHMWREALSERHADIDCTIMEPPPGAWLFTLKHDGGETKRGYHDDMGNAKHVGIYLGGGDVMHSTSAGGSCVQMDKLTSSRWTAWGLCKYIDYNTINADSGADRAAALEALRVIEHYIMGGGING